MRYRRGFTLVELLVTMAVALILMAGLYQFFVSQQRSYSTQDEVLRLQQEARMAEDLMVKAIQQTGAFAPSLGTTVSLRGQVILAASDHYLTLQYDDPYRDADKGVITAPEIVTYAVSKPSGSATERVGDDPTVAKASRTVRVFFDADGDGEVEASEAFDLAIPLALSGPPYTLYRVTPDDNGTPTFEAVAARVENLVLRYYDHNGNPLPRDPTTGAAVDPPYVLDETERAQVRTIEIELTLRTRNDDPRYSASFVYPAGTVGSYDTSGDPSSTDVTVTDGYRRRTFTTRVSPRNLSANTCGRIELVANPAQPSCPASSTVKATVMDQYGDPVSGLDVTFSVSSGSGATLSASTATTNASGEASTTVNYVGTSRVINVSAQAVVDCRPSGPAQFTLINAVPIEFLPGPSATVTVEGPSANEVYTCKDPKTFTFTAKAFDQCSNEVDPQPGLVFQAIDGAGSPFGTVEGSVSGTGEFQQTGEVFTVTPGTTAPATVNIQHQMLASPNWLTSLTGLPFSPGVSLIPWPPASLSGWTTDLAATSHNDCPSADTSSTFQVLDCVGNPVPSLDRESGYRIEATLTPDPSGPTGSGDQGILYSTPDVPKASGSESIQFTHGSGSSYQLSYAPPSCTLPPPSTRSYAPTVALSLEGPSGTLGSDSQSLTLGGCTDCEITASPTSLDSGTCQASATTTSISVGSCSAPDGTPVELEVITNGTGNASWELGWAGPVTTTTTTFSGGAATATLYKGTATTGSTLTIRAYVPSKADYDAGVSGSYMCEAVNLVSVDSRCDSIHVSNKSFTELGLTSTNTMTQNYPDPPVFKSGEKIYIEVFDCDENENSSIKDTIEVTVTSPQGYSPPTPDVETVILTETGVDTGIFRNNTNPLPVIYCGFPGVGDTSGNGYLFVREGFPIYIEYTDDDDPSDTACRLTASAGNFACSAFSYSYFAENYIHLDRHGVASNLTIGGNIWTNGEFELSSDMLADARGPDRVYGTGDDYTIVALGHISNGGQILGDVYAPSYDAYGPDGQGQNTQNFGTHTGTIQGDIYLRDGFRWDGSQFVPEVIGDDTWEKVPSYGTYTSLAAPDVAQPPPGSSVVVHPITHPNAIQGNVYTNYSSSPPKFDPNADPTYAQDPPNGEVLVAKDLPTFDLDLARTRAKDTTSDYHQWAAREGVTDGVDSDTYFSDSTAFKQFILATGGKTFRGACGDSYTSTSTVYIIGDPCEGTVFFVENGIDTSTIDLGGAQLIVNGALVTPGRLSIKGSKSGTQTIGGIAIYGCGERPVNWQAGWTGTIYEGKGSAADPFADLEWWFTDRGGAEPVPYALPALVGIQKVEVSKRQSHTLTSGIVYSEGEIHFHNDQRQGKAFLVGAEIGNIIHNCLYMDFQYNDCVKSSASDWFGCYCDTGGTPVSCTITVSPAARTVAQGSGSVSFTASASGGTPTYTWSVSGTSGGTISGSGTSATYTPGSALGTDTITVSDTAGVCLPAQATVTVIGSCATTVSPASVTVPVTQSQVFTASSPGGGPFTWTFQQNQSGGTLNGGTSATGDTVTYVAGSTGGIDRIEVTDAAGCTAAVAVVTVDPCFVKVSATEYDGASCTSASTTTVDAGDVVCLTATGGDGELHWYTDDPDGQFSFDGGVTWESGTSTVPTTSSNFSGDTLLYRAGTTLGTYTVTAKDTEDCKGNQVLSTCGMVFDAHPATIFDTQTLDVSVSNVTSAPATFAVSPAGSISSTGDTSAIFTPAGTGGVTITAQDAVGCTAATSVTVQGCPSLSVAHNPPDSPLTVGSTYTLTASGGSADYAWSLVSGSASLTKDSPTTASLVPKAEGPLSIQVTDANACPDSVTYTASCPTLSISHTPADEPLELGTKYTFSVSEGSAPYSWTLANGSGAFSGSGSTATYTPDDSGTVEIQVTDTYGCTGTYTGSAGCSLSFTDDFDDESLDSGWKSKDIGGPKKSGSVSEEDGVLKVKGGGKDIWGKEDEFHYVYRTGFSASDDFEVLVKVDSVEKESDWTKAGIMVRDSLDDDAKFVQVIATPVDKWHRLQWRSSTGDNADSTGVAPGLSFPYYLKLVKSGNTYTAYLSEDPSNFGSAYASTTVTMSGDIYVGLVVTAHKEDGSAKAKFDDFEISCP